VTLTADTDISRIFVSGNRAALPSSVYGLAGGFFMHHISAAGSCPMR